MILIHSLDDEHLMIFCVLSQSITNTICVLIQRLHPLKAVFQGQMCHRRTIKAPSNGASKCGLRLPGHKVTMQIVLRLYFK